jgi:XTP/dITP diphosphohydrolase
MKNFIGNKLVLATHNPGKVGEFREMFSSLGIEIISAGDLGLHEPEETGSTFHDNAKLKAVAAAKAANLAALADDSGMCVAELDGQPGIYSARWGGSNKDFAGATERVKHELEQRGKNILGAKAYFICVLSLAQADGSSVEFEGRMDGALTYPPRGRNGFGYDPIFVAEGSSVTYGEMTQEQKNRSNHRARAFAKFKNYLLK